MLVALGTKGKGNLWPMLLYTETHHNRKTIVAFIDVMFSCFVHIKLSILLNPLKLCVLFYALTMPSCDARNIPSLWCILVQF